MAFSYLCAPQVGWKVSLPGELALGVMWFACECVIVEQLSRTLLAPPNVGAMQRPVNKARCRTTLPTPQCATGELVNQPSW